MSNPQESCAERIGEHLAGRIGDLGALRDLADCGDAVELATLLEGASVRALFSELTDEMGAGALGRMHAEEIPGALEVDPGLVDGVDIDGLCELARERMDELPLGVSSYTTFRVDLSTGGPADWLEIVCSGDTPCYEPAGVHGANYEIERIVYHFSDWFDHAERQLDGVDFDIAERFARSVVPELVS